DGGLPSATPFGFVELTPEREYLLITEFFEGAVELGEANVDDALIDDGLRVIRLLWDAGLAHRDVKPANLLVRDGRIMLIDVAFLRRLPSSPRPVKVQRWTPRRVMLWIGLVVLVVLLGFNFSELFSTAEDSRTPLNVGSLACSPSGDLESLSIEAQSVQAAALIPCISSLPVGWSLGEVYANSGRGGFTLNHDRAGHDAL